VHIGLPQLAVVQDYLEDCFDRLNHLPINSGSSDLVLINFTHAARHLGMLEAARASIRGPRSRQDFMG
jgi:hypothetical protein